MGACAGWWGVDWTGLIRHGFVRTYMHIPQAMNAAEMAHAIPGEGRTVQQWLEQDKVHFCGAWQMTRALTHTHSHIYLVGGDPDPLSHLHICTHTHP